MDIAALKAAAAQIAAFPWPDVGGVAGPVPPAGDPTEFDLHAATEQVIRYEDELAGANAQVQALNDLWVALQAAGLSGHEAVGDDGDIYETAADAAADRFRAWQGYRDLVQQALILWAEARAKIEHDLEWQAYERATYGVKAETRGSRRRPELRIGRC